jgi:hypothetical protein
MLKLLDFDYEIQYKKGKENAVAYALSRQFQQEEGDNAAPLSHSTKTCQAISVLVPTWLEDVTDSYQDDERCLKLLQDLALNKDSHPKFTLQSGILRYQGRIYIGSATDLRTKNFHAFHSS